MDQAYKLNFDVKKMLLQKFNLGIINGHLEKNVMNKLDKIFYTAPDNEFDDAHILLFRLWQEEKRIVSLLTNDDCKKFLMEINTGLDMIKKNEDVLKVLKKVEKNENNVQID